jgi:hypothetical protein
VAVAVRGDGNTEGGVGDDVLYIVRHGLTDEDGMESVRAE